MDSACSIAAINLALTGELTDRIPACMSDALGTWIIIVQDGMPHKMRNSKEWREMLPYAAGTGRKLEAERSAAIIDWLWESVLPAATDYAKKNGFGDDWKQMLAKRDASLVKAPRMREVLNYVRLATSNTRSRNHAYAASYAGSVAREIAKLVGEDSWTAMNPPAMLKKLVCMGDGETCAIPSDEQGESHGAKDAKGKA